VVPNIGHQRSHRAMVPLGAHLGHAVDQIAVAGHAVAAAHDHLAGDWGAHLDSAAVDTAGRRSAALGAHLDSAGADTAGRRSVVLDAHLDFGVVGTAGRRSAVLDAHLDSGVAGTAGRRSAALGVAHGHPEGDCRLDLGLLGDGHHDRVV